MANKLATNSKKLMVPDSVPLIDGFLQGIHGVPATDLLVKVWRLAL